MGTAFVRSHKYAPREETQHCIQLKTIGIKSNCEKFKSRDKAEKYVAITFTRGQSPLIDSGIVQYPGGALSAASRIGGAFI